MSIDLTSCTGCGTCITACQAENNIPVVGKDEINRGRQMHWIRVDRYFADVHTKSGDETTMLMQPVACVHCENAPCETVCPVNATVHDYEGTNNMAYNRCIGTRYCATTARTRRASTGSTTPLRNTPAEYGQIAESIRAPRSARPTATGSPPACEEVNEIRRLQYNPNVTVRSRRDGEVLRIASSASTSAWRARSIRKINALGRIPDGYPDRLRAACLTDSIVFGDITNPDAASRRCGEHGRSYMILAYLNTRPRTTHMVRVQPQPGHPHPERQPVPPRRSLLRRAFLR